MSSLMFVTAELIKTLSKKKKNGVKLLDFEVEQEGQVKISNMFPILENGEKL